MTPSSVELEKLAQSLLSVALKSGADAADAVAVMSEDRSIEVRNGSLEHAESSEQTELGLRVLVGKRQAVVSISDKASRSMTEMAERAVVMAKLAPEDPFAGLADPEDLAEMRDASGLELSDEAAQPEPGELETIAHADASASTRLPAMDLWADMRAAVFMPAVWRSVATGLRWSGIMPASRGCSAPICQNLKLLARLQVSVRLLAQARASRRQAPFR